MTEAQDKTEPDWDALFHRMALIDWTHDAAADAGAVLLPEQKAYRARRVELIDEIDGARGTQAVPYRDFREAFEAGADCFALFELRNRMAPKDPLKEAANEDLRSVACYSPRARRREPGEV